ncbi:hypothetical protein EDD37DRAFT_650143 [Exophiala viscosa]|uniref:Uncharacterized protein n=1 Tax=Exophiala viscosa TaxID=2486360 RepID=A0AAN6IEU4_9EURO|nr:hypothetical protein EDD36DRAFT_462374 [Exophiala viscosa]KAI1624264.1 hypothetical protein EDD37DRAFT_650143 [Exophiala viscosa]
MLESRARLKDNSDRPNVVHYVPGVFNPPWDQVREEDEEDEEADQDEEADRGDEEQEQEDEDDFGQILIDRLQETLDKSVEAEGEQNEEEENDDNYYDDQVEEQIEARTNDQEEQPVACTYDPLVAPAQAAVDEGQAIVFKDVPMAKRPRDDGDNPKNQLAGLARSSKRQKILVYGEQANLTEMMNTQKNTGPTASTLARSRAAKAALPRGDWPHLRSAKTFSGFSLVEQSQTLKDWMSDIEDYVESIQAGAIPSSKVLAFFQRVNVHLNCVTETLDDIALGNERLTAITQSFRRK